MHYNLRVPTSADAPAVASVHVEGWRQTYAPLLPDGYINDEVIAAKVALWDALTANPSPERTLQIAEHRGTIVGLAFAGPTLPDEAEPKRPQSLHALYVLSAYHGTGVGQQLLESVLGNRPAELWVAVENPRAQAFYRRNGFDSDGVTRVDDDTPGLPVKRMFR